MNPCIVINSCIHLNSLHVHVPHGQGEYISNSMIIHVAILLQYTATALSSLKVYLHKLPYTCSGCKKISANPTVTWACKVH